VRWLLTKNYLRKNEKQINTSMDRQSFKTRNHLRHSPNFSYHQIAIRPETNQRTKKQIQCKYAFLKQTDDFIYNSSFVESSSSSLEDEPPGPPWYSFAMMG